MTIPEFDKTARALIIRDLTNQIIQNIRLSSKMMFLSEREEVECDMCGCDCTCADDYECESEDGGCDCGCSANGSIYD